MTTDVRRAETRFRTRTAELDSRHSFSFGPHYDPASTGHGPLIVNNEDVLAPGAGFGPHPHRDVDIVTWVLSGSLTHEDAAGWSGTVVPGQVQCTSAGSGIVHAERNASRDEPVHLVQMWVRADASGAPPRYARADTGDELRSGRLVPVASGLPGVDGVLPLTSRCAALHVARLDPGQQVALPGAPYVHVFVPVGTVTLEGTGQLDNGDAVRLKDAAAQRVKATTRSEVLVWEMHPDIDGGGAP
jgi:quercetin 2,3-dioxygenase